MFLCSKFITKKSRISSSQSLNVLSKVTKFVSIKLWVFMFKVFLNILLILIKLLRKRCKKVVRTDPSLQLKWMPPPVELIPLFRLNSSKRKWLREKREKNFLSFIWSIWLVVKKLVKLVRLVIVWKKLQVLTRVCQYWVWSFLLWPKNPRVRERILSFRTEILA